MSLSSCWFNTSRSSAGLSVVLWAWERGDGIGTVSQLHQVYLPTTYATGIPRTATGNHEFEAIDGTRHEIRGPTKSRVTQQFRSGMTFHIGSLGAWVQVSPFTGIGECMWMHVNYTTLIANVWIYTNRLLPGLVKEVKHSEDHPISAVNIHV